MKICIRICKKHRRINDMKKKFAIVLAVIITAGLTGCSILKRENPRGESGSSPILTSTSSSTMSTQPSESSTDNRGASEESSTFEESSAPEESSSESLHEYSGTSEESSSGGILGDIIRPEVKEAIDSYEAFIDEYCEFMKKYASSDNPLMLMSEYMDYLQELTEMGEKFDNMDESDWTAAETAYYTEVLLRCQKKLLDAADEM